MKNLLLFTALALLPSSLSLNAQSVQPAGADSRAQEFLADVGPRARAIRAQRLAERQRFHEADMHQVDPNQLFLRVDYSPRIYNLGKGATGYNNGLIVHLRSLSTSRRDIYHSFLAFQSFNTSNYGDFVDIGHQSAGTVIDSALLRNGSTAFRTWHEMNPGKVQHVIGFSLGDGFIMMGWEDMTGGGDLDYEDAVVVLDLGPENDPVDPGELPH